MKLVRSGNKLEGQRGFEGVYSAKLAWDIQPTPKVQIEYIGPYIPKEEWEKILSYFAWTYETAHSESQVRLYVNPKLDTWKAWAWPQEARTGMTSKELEEEWAPEQTALFNADEGWLLFGSVHHHCSGNAFQSGVDRHDEEKQLDGLHITMGSMNAIHHDMHARLYTGGESVMPDMSLFWDIGDQLVADLPRDLHDKIARYQMGRPSKIDFPEEWKANYREVKRETIPFEGSGAKAGYGYGSTNLVTRFNYVQADKHSTTEQRRIEFAADCIVDMAVARKWDIWEIVKFINSLGEVAERALLEELHRFSVHPWQVMCELNWLSKYGFDRDKARKGELVLPPDNEAEKQAMLEELKAEQAAMQKADDDGSPAINDEAKLDAWAEALQRGDMM